ncbi:hypothetical protein GALL_125650 [mine drainage metagenome]|uniref:Uncharacterized protein n=1 Tax=mine drainage metagenome TaxID=410659 RepID=A0A1J5SMD2_9ZZZZ
MGRRGPYGLQSWYQTIWYQQSDPLETRVFRLVPVLPDPDPLD